MERHTRLKVVEVPAGVDNGTQIRLASEGQPGTFGGPNGHLYISLQVKPHKFFRRRDDDIMLDLNINVAQATLGADVEVPTVDGTANLRIPSGTQPGKILTIKARGVPHLRSTGRGDQLVVVNIQVPTRLNAEQRKLFEDLAESSGQRSSPYRAWVSGLAERDTGRLIASDLWKQKSLKSR